MAPVSTLPDAILPLIRIRAGLWRRSTANAPWARHARCAYVLDAAARRRVRRGVMHSAPIPIVPEPALEYCHL